ncbi:MAG TPA: MarR family transcriptional regulator [Acetobacteraceae bacterium]|nr:MarR family transcriptional regulator [Acetobacteraceae bacterium]
MDRIEDCISFLLGKAAHQVSRRAREKLARWGVTPTQYAVLKTLWEQNGQTGAAIGARLAIDSATITGLIDRLAAAGLLERRESPEDRRINLLYLTPRGRALQVPLDAAMDALNAEVAAELRRAGPTVRRALGRLGEDPGQHE